MIKEFVAAWDANKDRLEEYFKTHEQSKYTSYETLLKLLIDEVINPYFVAGAQWVDKTMIEKAVKWLAPVFKDLAGYYSGGELLDDFKKVMEE